MFGRFVVLPTRVSNKVDVWSCGVIVYALLCGNLPFDDDNIPFLFKKIKGGFYTIPGYLSEDSKSLITKMLLVDPMKRITVDGIRKHPWFQTRLPRYKTSNRYPLFLGRP